VSTHAPPQLTVPDTQANPQLPFVHWGVAPTGAAQVRPHAPQCPWLRWTSTHAPAHASVPGPQFSVQTPFWHAWPEAQDWPQTPQFPASASRSTQVPSQSVRPARQRTSQRPAAQLAEPFSGAEQVIPQEPQFAASFARSTQRPSHSAKPALHSSEHVCWQSAVAFGAPAHARAQPPQWFTSRVVSAQAPPQLAVPSGH
jgi:hypothetical protein